MNNEKGSLPLAAIIGLGVVALVLIGGFATCDALWDDESEPGDVGMPALVAYHESDEYEYGSDYSSDDRNRNRGRNRGAFSPGPFDRSPVDAFNGNTICLPGSTCYTDGRRRDRPPPEEGGRA